MGPDDTEIDFPAVMGSRERLWSIYGGARGWPSAHVTPEQDRDDLAHHAREIAAHREAFCTACSRTTKPNCSEFVPRSLEGEWPMPRPRYVGRDLSWADWIALPLRA